MIVGVLTFFLSGSTGFVGSHVARVFLAHGWRVRALARRPERPGLLPSEVKTVRGDLIETDGYRRHLTDCQTEPFLRDLQIRPTTRWQDGIRRVCRWYVEARWLSSRAFASV